MISKKLFKKAFILLVLVGIIDLTAEKFYLYEYIWWLDIVVHFLAGVCIGVAALWLYTVLKKTTVLNAKKFLFLSFSAAIVVGALWEVYELGVGITSLSDGAAYVTDTLSDLLMDVTGGLLGVITSFRYFKNNEQK
jgi:hypothetical protein